jgi:general nucleoside transport system permease protein
MWYEIILSLLRRTLVAGTPLLLATLGEVITERSGVLNLGVEGMMSFGAVSAFIITFTTGSPWLGLLLAAVFTALFSLFHGFISVTLRANQVVSGLALTMLGLGLSGLWGKPFIGRPLTAKMGPIHIPGLSDIPFVGEVLFSHDPIFYLALALGFIAWFMFKYTRAGIVLRSVGENPRASEAWGVRVNLIRYISIMIGGAFAGMAGAHLSIAYSKSWNEGMVAGRGWIVIALTIFSLWNPARAFLGAFLFGGIFVLQYILQPFGISPNLLAMLPYLTTLAVLFVYGASEWGHRKMSPPATLGESYRRGER